MVIYIILWIRGKKKENKRDKMSEAEKREWERRERELEKERESSQDKNY